MIDKKIVFIDAGDSFIVRSIVKNLESMGLSCLILGWSVKDIERYKKIFSDIVVAYINDGSDVNSKALIYLRDVCIENCLGLYFAGYKEDIDDIVKKNSITNVAGEFYRPINANDMASQISTIMRSNPLIHKKHILVVDDSGTMLNTIQEWLGGRYRVSVVSSAMNAITFLDKMTPDLILLDYEMPGCSGAQLLEMLRADAHTQDIPVIFLTGKDDPESVKKVLTLKPSGYLLKTMPKEYIIGQVDEFFEKQKTL